MLQARFPPRIQLLRPEHLRGFAVSSLKSLAHSSSISSTHSHFIRSSHIALTALSRPHNSTHTTPPAFPCTSCSSCSHIDAPSDFYLVICWLGLKAGCRPKPAVESCSHGRRQLSFCWQLGPQLRPCRRLDWNTTETCKCVAFGILEWFTTLNTDRDWNCDTQGFALWPAHAAILTPVANFKLSLNIHPSVTRNLQSTTHFATIEHHREQERTEDGRDNGVLAILHKLPSHWKSILSSRVRAAPRRGN